MKTYQIKTYWYDWIYKHTINPNKLMNAIQFSSQINWWQWECRIQLAYPINTPSFDKSDIVKIVCYDDDNINGRLVYTGGISRIKRYIQPTGEYIELTCLWLFSLLNRILYYSGAYNFTKTDEPANIIKDILDYFNTQYTGNFFSYAWIENYWQSITLNFNYKKCNESISDIQKATPTYFFYIWADGVIKYKNSWWTLTNHRLKIENQIQEVYIEENIESSVNKLFVWYTEGVAWPYSDWVMQTQYGIIERKQDTPNGTTSVWAPIRWTDYLEKNKEPKKQIQMTVNNKYDIESIEPWHLITILNTEYETNPLLVNKVQYSYDKVVLSLDKYETIAETILSNK